MGQQGRVRQAPQERETLHLPPALEEGGAAKSGMMGEGGKEVREESGVKNVRPASKDIFSLEVLTVDGHMKRGKYVSSHLHLNVTYLLIADDTDALTVKPDENSGVKWFTPEGAVEASSEKWFREHVYNKLNEKMRQFHAEKK